MFEVHPELAQPRVSAVSNPQSGKGAGSLNVADGIALLGYLFSGAAAPPPPFDACGIDPTPDALECEKFGGCP